jgi:predicted alpha-1,6-mannanase (GH76 family)
MTRPMHTTFSLLTAGLLSASLIACSAADVAATTPVAKTPAANAAGAKLNTASLGGGVGLPLDTYASLQVATPGLTDRFLLHRGGLGITEIVKNDSPEIFKKDGTFKLVRGLADPECYSFESYNFPGEYLRHAYSRVRKDKSDGSDGFKGDATWCARPGLSGSGVSFESRNFPNHYLRHFNAQAWLAVKAGPLLTDRGDSFEQDVSWAIADGWSGSTVPAFGTAEQRDDQGMSRLLQMYDPKTNGWTKGATLDTIINAYERTRDPRYLPVLDQSFASSQGWRSGDANKVYFDDMGWYANAWIRAYDVTKDQKYLNEAKAIFGDMTPAWDNTCGGGLWWNSERKYKNAVTNELFLLIAARLHRRAPNGTGDGSYYDWAFKEWNWFKGSGLINSSNGVNDGLENCNSSGPTWTYNQGIILSGLVEMWRINGDRAYLFEAEKIADHTINTQVYPGGILKEPGGAENICKPESDDMMFKSGFVQGLARLYNADRNNKPQYFTFLSNNADSVWTKSRDNNNTLGLNWSGAAGCPNKTTHASAMMVIGQVALLNAGGETNILP